MNKGFKIIAVGDDWQSIYAFSGSDVSLFTDFEKIDKRIEKIIKECNSKNIVLVIPIEKQDLAKECRY